MAVFVVGWMASALGASWKTTAQGVPIGRWMNVQLATLPPLQTARMTNILTIRPDGSGWRTTTLHYELDSGHAIATGKFAGKRGVKWTEEESMGRAQRRGDSLVLPGNPRTETRLVEGFPPGFSRDDYRTLGGTLSSGIFGSSGGAIALLISGDNLVLRTAGGHWIYRWIGP